MPRYIKDRQTSTTEGPYVKKHGRPEGDWDVHNFGPPRYSNPNKGLKGGGNSALGIPRPDRLREDE